MKRCPTCNLTFEEDWLSFCTQDGTTLIDDAVSASEPAATIMAPAQSDAPAWNTPSAELPPSSPAWRPPQRAVPEWQPPPPPYYVQPQSKSLATAAMILGIISVTVGWLCLGPLFAIAAIVLGAVALSQIKKTPERVGGKQMAWIGVVTGSLALLGIIILYVFVIIASNL
ncbi:MAG TPA: DUF4190 domain-containing protein [Aestuariivirgaceae bacterium]|nr:DUF4190 domain-containing protein [Aestuariivirgaceae bacterium]